MSCEHLLRSDVARRCFGVALETNEQQTQGKPLVDWVHDHRAESWVIALQYQRPVSQPQPRLQGIRNEQGEIMISF